jgi:hypothetical protein
MNRTQRRRLVVFTLVAACVSWAGMVRAQDAVELPPDSLHLIAPDRVAVGQSFSVSITANISTAAYGFGFQLTYDPSHLRVEARADADGQPVLVQVGDLFHTAQRIRNSQTAESGAARLDVVYTLLPPAEAIQGVGTLGTVAFTVLQEGPAEIRLLNPRLIALEGTAARDISLALGEPALMLNVGGAEGVITTGRLPERSTSGISTEVLIVVLLAIIALLLAVIAGLLTFRRPVAQPVPVRRLTRQ